MARIKPWTREQFAEAVKGGAGFYGLRQVATGFEAADGYDLRHVGEWSYKRRLAVQREYENLKALTKQPTIPKRFRNKKNLRQAQEHFHHTVKSKRFKVALLPDNGPTIERLDRRTGKVKRVKVPPKVTFHKNGSIDVDYDSYKRRFYAFNQRALLDDPDAEIKRGIRTMPGARTFFAAVAGDVDDDTGESMLMGVALAGDSRGFINKIINAMNRYDGVSAITSGKHRGENPAHHYHGDWLHGMYGFMIRENRSTNVDVQAEISAARIQNKETRKRLMWPWWRVISENGVVLDSFQERTKTAALERARATYGNGVTVEL